MWSKEELDTYLNSWSEGDNITITADCLNMLEATSKDLAVLEILKNHLRKGEKVRRWLTARKRRKQEVVKTIEMIIYQDEEDFKKIEEWLQK